MYRYIHSYSNGINDCLFTLFVTLLLHYYHVNGGGGRYTKQKSGGADIVEWQWISLINNKNLKIL